MALFAADQVRTDRKTGAIQLAGNRYWAPELVELAGQAVTIRFDPEQLHAPIHVYDRAGRFLVTAALWEATGFLDMGAAKKRQRLERDWKKKTKARSEEHTSELQSLMRISYAVYCLYKTTTQTSITM